jgi:hypothetical protein
LIQSSTPVILQLIIQVKMKAITYDFDKDARKRSKYPYWGRPGGEPTEIEAGMAASQIARILAKKTMALVVAQIEAAEKKYHASQQADKAME